MKLLLTSTGLDTPVVCEFFVSMFSKSINEARILVIAAPEHEHHFEYIHRDIATLKEMGFLDVVFLNLSARDLAVPIVGYDGVYVMGGNTYHYVDGMRRHDLLKPLRDMVQSDAPYMGASAGSIIAGPSIEISGWGIDGDTNDINMTDFTAFGFVDFAVFPHYEPARHDNELRDIRSHVSYEVVPITNTQSVYSEGGAVYRVIE